MLTPKRRQRLRTGWLVAATVLALLAFGCEPEPRAPSSEPSRVVGLDVELPVWELGRWTTSGFTETLRDELAHHNIHIAPSPAPGQSVALVNLGVYNNRRAIDVAIVRGGRTMFTGRVLIPDRSMTTLDKAAELVASIIAGGLPSEVDPAVHPVE
jgi:hypothetical protein